MAGRGGGEGDYSPWRTVRTVLSAALVVLSLAASAQAQSDSSDWTDWGEPSPCSRTCGVGVSYRSRTCLRLTDDGSPACIGPDRHYSTCNTQDCPHGAQEFRLQQCEHYNNISFDGEYYEWVPHYGATNKCELNCLAKGETFYYRHAAKVVDGTPCDHTTRDICIDGVCQEVGCDSVLGSGQTVDKCGECGGDGSSCITQAGFLDTDDLKSGYNDLILIPAGAMSISFEETRPGNSYLALRDLAGTFLLNGNWKIEAGHTLEAAGTSFTYTRGAHPSDQAEKLTAQGPTTHSLFFSVLRQPGPSPQVSYEYSLPLSVQHGAGHTYSWVPSAWGACSATCGHGEQKRMASCERTSDGVTVADSLCDVHGQPTLTQPCTAKPCPATWHVGLWEQCSTTCGEGVRARSVFCQRAEKGDLFTIVQDDQCQAPKPESISSCNQKVICPKWQVGKWSQCNRVCGLGQQTRTVYCLAQHPLPDAASDILPSMRCDPADQPISARECNEGPCDGLEWVVSAWSGCLGECGHMMETRRVVCSSKLGEVFNDTMCDGTKRPTTTRPCPANMDCTGQTQWHSSQWSQCSAMCGPGVKTRTVTCVQVHGDVFKKVDDDQCDPAHRMHETTNCTGENCWGVWFSGPFGKCSVDCGSGKMKREVLCFYGDQVATVNDCDEALRPPFEEPCIMEACDDENSIGGCKDSEFGCCPDGTTAAEGPEYFGCQVKDRIPTGACIETEYGCCLDGVTPAQGPFNAGCPYFTCKDMAFGCCPDGQTPAGGVDSEGCPEQFGCAVTAYGCCPDGVTASNGFNNEGCEAPVKTCADTTHGCCPDGVTEAAGPEQAGCDTLEGSGVVCEESTFGCCPDRITAATGPHQEGCNELSSTCGFSLYGCCPDGTTAAEGPNSLGCPGVIVRPVIPPCASTAYGCCPDGETAALGEDNYGCHKIVVNCASTRYGCCEDGISVALGENLEGCPAACLSSEHGCCPDGTTPATGPGEEGCSRQPILVGGCAGTRHGCCPDNSSYATGPYYHGCNVTKLVTECDMTTYGCCMDGETVAAGHDFFGCPEAGTYQRTCRDSPYGCCPDAISPADGPNYTGCPSLINRGASCGLTSDTGPCSNFTVKWYFDALMGDCARFWYGGCEGNDNRFDNREDCQATCVKPEGIMSCYLPKSVGRCRASVESWYYNPEDRECESFMYGGCLGNDNRFESIKACEDKCITPQTPDLCSQPHLPGPCRGNFARWFYDKTTGHCRQFIYGGCMGNDNRFETQELCEQRCQQPAVKVCQLPMDTGPCRGAFHKFYFDAEARQCREFIYGGCHGNSNRFTSLPECQSFCHELVQKVVDVCMLPQDAGPCHAYMERWHFDPTDGYCKQFVYGGCQGNENRFETEEQCRSTCSAKIPMDVCALDVDSGPCEAYHEQYAYDRQSGQCTKFVYGGCEGNANRFTTLEECKKICPDAQDHGPATGSPAPKDVCQLTKDAGPCYAYQTRFFYDPLEGECMSFTYGGCQGNDNNFATLEECRSQCKSGGPGLEPVTEPSVPLMHPKSHVHRHPPHQHVAPASRTVSRRSAATRVCDQPVKPGSCGGHITRYFYDSETRRCSPFIFSGCQGNKNNFLSRRECQKECPSHISEVCSLSPDKGPCQASRSRYYFDTDHGLCRPFTYGGCMGNGNNFHTVDECQLWCLGSLSDVCGLPQEPGPCEGYNIRYYYNTQHSQCVTFVYSGCGGNANNFISAEACKTRCADGGTHYVPGITDICSQKMDSGPCYEWEARYFYNTTSSMCEYFFYGGCEGNGNNFATKEECAYYCAKKTSASTTATAPVQPKVTDICAQKLDSGPCYEWESRYFYNTSSSRCEHFFYGGCDGNGNNFATKEECAYSCAKKTTPTSTPTATTTAPVQPEVTDICAQKLDSGPCYEWESRYFYNASSSRCEHFFYGGCDGNGNNFATKEECTYSCEKKTTLTASAATTATAPVQTEVTDICAQKLDSGPCYEWESRYFYNASSSRCEHFFYGGCEGNGNNFATQEECSDYCGKKTASTTTTTTTTAPVQPKVTDICQLEKDPGPCYAHLTKYYFDYQQRACMEFVYGGCLGNHNNFESYEDCEAYCGHNAATTKPPTTTDVCTQPRDPGPCYGSITRFYYDPTDGRCLEFVYGGCQGNANNFHSAEDCSNRCGGRAPTTSITGDRCQLPKDSGVCLGYMPRYYYDASSGGCKQFIYGGCQGNRNRFMSEEDCREACTVRQTSTTTAATPIEPTHPAVTEHTGDICEEPLEQGPCREYIPSWYYNSTIDTCVLFVYGGCEGNGNRFSMKSDCERHCTRQDICQMPMDEGECRGYQPSWYYNSAHGRCQAFVWGGCGGNANRFETIEECQTRCGPKPTKPRVEPTGESIVGIAVCALRSDPGPCRESISRWYFDNEDGMCKQFIYGGCRGNENNFETKEACLLQCPLTDICELPSETGPCRAAKRRFFYNHETEECEQFTYGGCQGNANRFLMKESCESVCKEGPIEVMPPGEETDVCTLSMDPGPCAAYTRFYFYNIDDNSCREFTYGGCLGNGNRFETEEDCRSRCHREGVPETQPTTQHPHHTRGHHTHTHPPTRHTTHRVVVTDGPRVATDSPGRSYTTPGRSYTDSPAGDVCGMTKDPGPCTDYTPVWYFEFNTRTCRRFLFGGCDGNGNRFDSRLDCESTCLYTEKPTTIMTTTPRAWHHHTTPAATAATTATATTTRETSIEYDLCSLDSDAGPCRDNITVQWYYHVGDGECQRFLYGGCDGNANRFATQKECEKICVLRQKKATPWIPPPPPKAPAIPQFNSVEKFKSNFIDIEGVCEKPADMGPCNDTLQRWHFDMATQQCEQFVYGGCEGNGNRFETEEQCRQVCGGSGHHHTAAPVTAAPTQATDRGRGTEQQTNAKDVCTNTVDPGPCKASVRRWYFDTKHQICKDFLYGGCQGNGNNFASREKCQVYCHANVLLLEDICMLPAEQGPCSAGVRKWHYDYAQSRCVEFTYGGCLGNENQFDTEELCQAECGGTIVPTQPSTIAVDVCQQPEHRGPCYADYLRYFYDSETQECRPFIYGGCQANDNNFETQEDCYNRCGDGTKEPVIRKPGDCYLAPDAGPCRAAEKRYHFDPAQGDCVAFYYGGCEGNGNNFGHYKDCIAMCSKATVSCGVLSCDLKCPGEYARGPDGCLQCRCHDPCEGHRCDEGFECEVQQIHCVTTPCPPVMAVCVPKQRDGECPEQDVLRMGSCDRPCERDADCAGADKCCSSSCGYQCTAPAGPAYQLPQCPPMDGELATTTVSLCSRDVDCPHGGRCCSNAGGGQVCLAAEQLPGCAGSVLGCCPDGVTPAKGYNFQGCPEEEPVIYDRSEEDRLVTLGNGVVLTCLSRGSPRPQITWYKDGFPVLADDTGRYAELEDNSLEIRSVDTTDSAIFTCRAFNGVGTSATKAYAVTVTEPVMFGEMQSVVTAHEGTTAILGCVAEGRPEPTITWLRAGSQLFLDGGRVSQAANDSLVIRDVTMEDKGDYICEASNGVAAPSQRMVILNVHATVPDLGPLSVVMSAHNDTNYVGGDVRLLCIVTGDGDITTKWTKDGVPVVFDDRIKMTPEEELFIEDVVPEDAGTYRCTATRGTESVSVEAQITIAGLRLPENCTDKPWLANCVLIVQARLCRHVYFSDFCCQSCHEAGQLP